MGVGARALGPRIGKERMVLRKSGYIEVSTSEGQGLQGGERKEPGGEQQGEGWPWGHLSMFGEGPPGHRQQRATLSLQGRALVPHSWGPQDLTNCTSTSLPCLCPVLSSRLSQPSWSLPALGQDKPLGQAEGP
ncbi:hypothetical protein HJG60_010586 [Phyllostomus discolor]|uniref:Uncharacterized protein n=1 Tax=Phyllostomus discolor TaxID=89673 RepID=A0A834EHL3_9CHIR|nr:hypothetical protein HJG60_010586 [Phyllostomus discolor]